jgi:hypothetical protein
MRRGVAVLVLGMTILGAAGSARAQTPAVKFGASVTMPVGSGPFDLVVEDFNNNGNKDVAVANSDSSDVTVLWGNGNGTFLDPGVTFSVGDFPVAIAAGQLTNDTNLDLVTANDGSFNLSVLMGTGSGASFNGPTNSDAGGSPEAVALGDFNNDGKTDVATAELFDDTVTVRLGNKDATGTFGLAFSTDVLGSPFGLAAANLVGDSNLDLVVALNDLSMVAVLTGNGDGTFAAPDCTADPTPAGCYLVGTSPAGVALADLNNDLKLDIVVANEDSDDVSVLLNNGDGTFGPATSLDAGVLSFPEVVRVADFNGDGKPDIVSANSGADSVAVFRGKGDGTFEAADIFDTGGTSPFSVAVADVNNDQQPDILTANVDSDDISILLNETAGGGTGCLGDCDGDHKVSAEELVTGIDIVLGIVPANSCTAFEGSGSAPVTVVEVATAVDNALNDRCAP